jgi:hypothetical protein
MKNVIVALAIITVVGSTTAFAQDGHSKKHKKHVTAVKYTCTMHPEVVMDMPGKCPKCGMKLVPLKNTEKK